MTIGIGDQILGSGLARGAAFRGKRIAFGDGRKILWDQFSEQIFRHNVNIAAPGQEGASNLEWVAHYKGHRLYNSAGPERWIWNYDFKATPGEICLTAHEKKWFENNRPGFVVIEPNVSGWKSMAPNKQWAVGRYETLAGMLRKDGLDVVQMVHAGGHTRLLNARHLHTGNFRIALSVLSRAALYIGPEGGLHHGAAAVGIPAVVLFGGFVPPQVTGYDSHTNLTGGADEACGSWKRCEHCVAAMNRIGLDEVRGAAHKHLEMAA